ncbi:MAG: hypothetical protein E7220_06855 [Clostridiales bacterium]|nr:hypothetical protein [Clostridiales bacterium]
MGSFDVYLDKAKEVAESAGDKLNSLTKDVRAVKEISRGLAELEALPEIEGSIIYSLEIGTLINYLKSLLLVVQDNRIDDGSVTEEIKEVMAKVQPEEAAVEDESEKSEEQKAIDHAKSIVYDACSKALASINE